MEGKEEEEEEVCSCRDSLFLLLTVRGNLCLLGPYVVATICVWTENIDMVAGCPGTNTRWFLADIAPLVGAYSNVST
jgi:hypothetical protein